jgi:hypothetical protein
VRTYVPTTPTIWRGRWPQNGAHQGHAVTRAYLVRSDSDRSSGRLPNIGREPDTRALHVIGANGEGGDRLYRERQGLAAFSNPYLPRGPAADRRDIQRDGSFQTGYPATLNADNMLPFHVSRNSKIEDILTLPARMRHLDNFTPKVTRHTSQTERIFAKFCCQR